MIINIDNRESVKVATEEVSRDWLDPAEMYAGLKTDGKTDSSGFWGKAEHMIADVSEFLGLTLTQFLDEWDQRCIDNDTKFMGYHCTRHSNKHIFLEKGILPLSEETV